MRAFLFVLTLLAAAVLLASPASAACTSVSFASACDIDGDGVPDVAGAAARVPGVGSVDVVAYRYELWGSTFSAAGASAGTDPDGALGHNTVAAYVLCYDYDSDDDCDFLYAGGGLYGRDGLGLHQVAYVQGWQGVTALCVEGDLAGHCQPLPV